MPPPVLLGCVEPLDPAAIDMRGTWRVVGVAGPKGEPREGSPLIGLVQRIEQAGNRLVVTAGGVVHDMVCDGTLENGVEDVAADGTTPLRVAARWEDGVHCLYPFGLADGPPLVTRRLDGEDLIWDYGGARCRCERVRDRLDVRLRPEEPVERDEVSSLVASAFGSLDEARLVEALRDTEGLLLSLVAVSGEQLAGHVMVSTATLRTADGDRSVASLSPLAVRPDLQGRGVGAALVRSAQTAVAATGEKALFVEGDPEYYGRFGFGPASRFAVRMPLPGWAPSEAAQVALLAPDAQLPPGEILYPPAFAAFSH